MRKLAIISGVLVIIFVISAVSVSAAHHRAEVKAAKAEKAAQAAQLKSETSITVPSTSQSALPAPSTENCPTDNSSSAGIGPNPYDMPSFGGAQNYSCMLQQEVNQVAPMATQDNGSQTGVEIPQVSPN